MLLLATLQCSLYSCWHRSSPVSGLFIGMSVVNKHEFWEKKQLSWSRCHFVSWVGLDGVCISLRNDKLHGVKIPHWEEEVWCPLVCIGFRNIFVVEKHRLIQNNVRKLITSFGKAMEWKHLVLGFPDAVVSYENAFDIYHKFAKM